MTEFDGNSLLVRVELLFENVAFKRIQARLMFNEMLGVAPVLVHADLVTHCRRSRFDLLSLAMEVGWPYLLRSHEEHFQL